MATTEAIREQIEELSPGELFTNSSLLKFGSRAAVDQALSREQRAKNIMRVTRGLYVKPERNERLGIVAMPSLKEVARKVVEDEGAIFQVHGAEAARRMGLSTQMQTKHVFLTSGTPRQFQYGNATVTIKRVSPKKLTLAGRPAGLAHIALLYLGKNEVDLNTIAAIEERLSDKEFDALLEARHAMPGWLSDVLRRFRRNREEVV
jgi:hypothetical protein